MGGGHDSVAWPRASAPDRARRPAGGADRRPGRASAGGRSDATATTGGRRSAEPRERVRRDSGRIRGLSDVCRHREPPTRSWRRARRRR